MTMSAGTKQLAVRPVWASNPNAQTEPPETLGLTRTEGWPVAYEQPLTGKTVERLLVNNHFRELVAVFRDITTMGILAWDADVDYAAGAFVATASGLHVARVVSGPGSGNPTDPDGPGQTVWRVY